VWFPINIALEADLTVSSELYMSGKEKYMFDISYHNRVSTCYLDGRRKVDRFGYWRLIPIEITLRWRRKVLAVFVHFSQFSFRF